MTPILAKMHELANNENRHLRLLEKEKPDPNVKITKPVQTRRAKIVTDCCGALVDPDAVQKHGNNKWCGKKSCADALRRWRAFRKISE